VALAYLLFCSNIGIHWVVGVSNKKGEIEMNEEVRISLAVLYGTI